MENATINYLAVIVAALSDFVVGALWYSPLLFAKPWMKANGFTPEDLKKGNPAVTYTVVLVLSLVISYILALFLGTPDTDATRGLAVGVHAGVLAVCAMTVIALFEKRSLGYILVNSGYIFVGFVVKGLILGAWR